MALTCIAKRALKTQRTSFSFHHYSYRSHSRSYWCLSSVLDKTNSYPIKVLSKEISEETGDLSRENSNAILKLGEETRTNSNTLLYLNRTDSNAKLFLARKKKFFRLCQLTKEELSIWNWREGKMLFQRAEERTPIEASLLNRAWNKTAF